MQSISVFTYGTLEVPAVMKAVTGRVFESKEGIVEGYARYLLKGRIYPGMTPISGKKTEGRVYLGLNHQALKLLDEFEDEIYVRHMIVVRVNEGHRINAYAYIIEPNDREILSVHPWIQEKFIEAHLTPYLEACRNFHLASNRDASPSFPNG